MKNAILCVAFLAIAIAIESTAEAHKASDSYLELRVDGERLVGQWDIALRDLDHAIGLDADGDGAITWGELRARHAAIAAYALPRLEIRGDGATCVSRAGEQLVDRHSDGAYAVLRFAVDCPRAVTRIDLRYGLFFDVDPQHRGLLTVLSGGQERRFLFSAERGEQSILLGSEAAPVADLFREGMATFWSNPWAVVFLALVMLGIFVERRGALVKVAAAAAVAISLGLSLVAFGAVAVNPILVSALIRVSLAFALLACFSPMPRRGRGVVGCCFLFAHGAAFGEAWRVLPLATTAGAGDLLVFHVGIVSGLAALVSISLVAAVVARRLIAPAGFSAAALEGRPTR